MKLILLFVGFLTIVNANPIESDLNPNVVPDISDERVLNDLNTAEQFNRPYSAFGLGFRPIYPGYPGLQPPILPILRPGGFPRPPFGGIFQRPPIGGAFPQPIFG